MKDRPRRARVERAARGVRAGRAHAFSWEFDGRSWGWVAPPARAEGRPSAGHRGGCDRGRRPRKVGHRQVIAVGATVGGAPTVGHRQVIAAGATAGGAPTVGHRQVIAAGATAGGARGRSANGRSSRRVRPREATAEGRPSAGHRGGCDHGRRPEGRQTAGHRGGCDHGRRPRKVIAVGAITGGDRGRSSRRGRSREAPPSASGASAGGASRDRPRRDDLPRSPPVIAPTAMTFRGRLP